MCGCGPIACVEFGMWGSGWAHENSSMRPRIAGLELFAARAIRLWEASEKSDWKLVCKSLITQIEEGKSFGQKVRSVHVQAFCKWARNAPEQVMKGNGTELTVLVIENQFYASSCVNDVDSSVVNRNIVGWKRLHQCWINVIFKKHILLSLYGISNITGSRPSEQFGSLALGESLWGK